MNQFFKNVFSSAIGVLLALVVLIGLVFLIALIGAALGGGEQVKVSKKTVLHIKLDQPIPEKTNNVEMSPFSFNTDKVIGLNDILSSIHHAAGDDKIEGIFLDLNPGTAIGLATAGAIRDALLEFKDSGKFIIAWSKNYSQGAYYLASVADKVYLGSLGGIDLHGFAATITFFKEMLDKLGIKMQVFYAGDFKSATEPFRRTDMSEENRLQLREFLNPLYNRFLSEIGASRGKSVAELKDMANNLRLTSGEEALRLGMVDQLGYIDTVLADMRHRIGLGEKDKLKTVSLPRYSDSFTKKITPGAKDKIAVVYAEGTILQDKGERGSIVDNKYVKMLRKIRKDKKVKAIVLRVNSPGGSAIASENIWRELVLAKEAGKPVVVSMGDYAASGGYYISCMADSIFAQPNTLTGSIGVFSMIINMGEFYNKKLKIHFDTVLTSRYSVGLNSVFEMDDFEKQHWQKYTDRMYEIFLRRVAEGRGLSRDSVHQIAQGRIWIGTKAKEIGLVDAIGDLDDAIAAAANLAGLDKYRTTEYPRLPDFFQELINELTGQKDDDAIQARLLKKELGPHYAIYQHLRDIIAMEGPQAKMQVLLNFD